MSGGALQSKPNLSQVTLLCLDTSDKAYLGSRAIFKCLEQCNFKDVKFLTNNLRFPHAVKVSRLSGIEDYSRFMIRELHKYVDTPHVLIVQWDGMILNGGMWTDKFMGYDYIGSPWMHWGGKVGNGGFSLRSKRLLEACARMAPDASPHPCDAFICHAYRQGFEALGMKFAPTSVAARFGFEGAAFNGREWISDGRPWNNAFGFHSYLSPLPGGSDRPTVFYHSGDAGDVVYSLAVARVLGGGTYFVGPDCRYPYPKKPKSCALDAGDFCNNIGPLVRRQSYIWNCQPTGMLPHSTDVDFNEFRLAYKRGGVENWESLLHLHANQFGVTVDAAEPWLECDEPIEIPGRPIVVNKTQRYLNHKFPWFELVRQYGDRMVFIGSEQEHQLFQGYAPHIPIPRCPTSNMWDACRVIAGAKVFIGNQSAPLAIAHGLGQRCIVEEWVQNPNCHIIRPGAIYFRHGNEAVNIPAEWIK